MNTAPHKAATPSYKQTMNSMAAPKTDTVFQPHNKNGEISSIMSFPVRAQDLATLLGGELVGNPDIPLNTLGSIEDGSPETLTFIRSSSYAKLWADSSCGCALVTKDIEVPEHNPDTRALIRVKDADEAMVMILEAVNPKRARPTPGIHSSTVVDPDATIDPSAAISPG